VLIAARRGHLHPQQLALAAWGTPAEVFTVTHDKNTFKGGKTVSSNLVGGTHWYLWPEHAFGFSLDPQLHLWYADVGDQIRYGGSGEIKDASSRLSWNLESGSTGGYRAGEHGGLGTAPCDWMKCVYYLC